MLFAIFPYLKTSKPIKLRGINFFPSENLKNEELLPDLAKSHLATLFGLFYLQNDVRVTKLLYTYAVLDQDIEKFNSLIRRLREARTVLGYFYTSPHFPSGDPFISYEHSDLYIFLPGKVSTFTLGLELNNEKQNDSEIADVISHRLHEVDGYRGSVNIQTEVYTAKGCRLYPSVHNFGLNISQDVYHDFRRDRAYSSWPLKQIMIASSVEDEPFEQRIFTAMEWYNRSCLEHITEDVALVDLAIALESLLALEEGKEIRARFKDTILSLLGKIPRLDSWIEQFYDARSSIVHEGTWQHLAFYAADTGIYKNILKGNQLGVRYRTLTSIGRQIFRLCLTTILTGNMNAHRSGLQSLLHYNQERLESICKTLTSSLGPDRKLIAISRDIFDLQEYWFESESSTDLKTVIGTATLLIRVFLETNPILPNTTSVLLQEFLVSKEEFSDTQQLERLSTILDDLEKSGLARNSSQRRIPKEFIHAIVVYLEYATGPSLQLKARGHNFGT
jgi:hypothetical protein